MSLDQNKQPLSESSSDEDSIDPVVIPAGMNKKSKNVASKNVVSKSNDASGSVPKSSGSGNVASKNWFPLWLYWLYLIQLYRPEEVVVFSKRLVL